MGSFRETLGFGLVLAGCLAIYFHETLLGDRILSPADVLLVEASFRPGATGDYEPINRLLMDPVLQFQPWLEFNRTLLRQGRLPLWNPYAGCGAPHLACGQSAVFDPFQLIAYLGTVPRALAWMGAGRLWVAGLGMFFLARSWGCGCWGRWFAGLVYPFCGFSIVWLLYPVTPVAIWLPWLLLASDGVLNQPRARRAGMLSVVVGLVIVGGHIQTSAHALLAAGLFVSWRAAPGFASWRDRRRRVLAWSAGVALGLLLGAAQIIPLGYYLAKSPVWGDRQRETKAWWVLSRPRLPDVVCTAFPYMYGSQRRGHPNLARGLGVHNLNESAGGYAGLATLIWLAPLALGQRGRRPEVGFLVALGAVGAMGAFRLFPVDNLLRALPVLDVTDNRRLALWVAFSLSLLGAFGIDGLARGEHLARSWIAAWLVGAGLLGGIAIVVPRLEPLLRREAERHYSDAARVAPQSDMAIYQARGERQIRAALAFLPRYYGLAACELLALAVLALLSARQGRGLASRLPPVLIGLTLIELAHFGMGLNPAIAPETQSFEPPLITRLRRGLEPGQRALGIGEELPPNVLMRFGLSDPRNYDSVELARSLRWFAPLFEPGSETLSSRGQITWEGVHRARDRLEDACVKAIVGASPPPPGRFARVERTGDIWIAWLGSPGWASSLAGAALVSIQRDPGRCVLRTHAPAADQILIRETWDAGWTARIDGDPVPISTYRETFMTVSVPAGDHVIELEYQPGEVIYGLMGSALGMAGVILALTEATRFWIPGITKTGLGRTLAPKLKLSL
ncbi:MAG TPA: YfhO family protein [Isosphaeraceae bacterium]|nr:YfhO family protein [Isosphaeraceae bacterium]